jgi:hypothetical protein
MDVFSFQSDVFEKLKTMDSVHNVVMFNTLE